MVLLAFSAFSASSTTPPNAQVEQKYLANIYVDDLPIYGPVGINDPDMGFSIFVNHK